VQAENAIIEKLFYYSKYIIQDMTFEKRIERSLLRIAALDQSFNI